MGARILIIQGHPDCGTHHLCHTLAQAYESGARGAGHTVDTVEPGRLDFPLLHSAEEWRHAPVPAALAPAQQAIGKATHLVLVYPLWLGEMPALGRLFLSPHAHRSVPQSICRATRCLNCSD